MAIIDLGKVSITWRGAYDGSTAYTPKDAVVYNNASYICIANTTGNLPTDTSYWNVMAAKGVDGTDLTTTLTTQGDIVYRDGSGLQRLGAGTAGQVLQTGGSGANVSWGTISSDCVKILDQDITSNASSVSVTGWIDNSTYQSYEIHLNRIKMTATDSFKFHWINDSGSPINTGSDYFAQADHDYLSGGSGSTNTHVENATNGARMVTNNFGTSHYKQGILKVSALSLGGANHTVMFFEVFSRESGGQMDYGDGFVYYDQNTAFTNSSAGFLLDRLGSGEFTSGNITIYGLK